MHASISIAGTIGSVNVSDKVTSVSVAVDTGFYDKKKKEWVNHTSWYRVPFFGDYAKNVGDKYDKGMAVIVTGTPEIRSYTKNDGTEGTSVEIKMANIKSLEFLRGGEKKSSGSGGGSSTPRAAAPADDSFDADDDLPF